MQFKTLKREDFIILLEGIKMSEQQIHVFVPSMDGEYVPVAFTSPEEDMKDSQVLIFVNDEDRQIFIWTGSNSNVRKRFISSQIARQMRMENGLTHRVSTEEQGNETAKFRNFMNSFPFTVSWTKRQ